MQTKHVTRIYIYNSLNKKVVCAKKMERSREVEIHNTGLLSACTVHFPFSLGFYLATQWLLFFTLHILLEFELADIVYKQHGIVGTL